MNFFKHQEIAKANSKKLFALFLFLVFVILFIIEFSIYWVFDWVIKNEAVIYNNLSPEENAIELLYFRDRLMLGTGILASLTIFLSAAYEMYQTKKEGGKYIASLVGATRLVKGEGSFLEERFLNIVEEMAIAASIPVPSAWVLKNEPSINAFAAGWSLQDAVICVNEGTLEYLSREELQGVVAHEISHIVHSDMTLNLKASSLIFGLTSLKVLGSWLLEMGVRSSFRKSASLGSSSSKSSNFTLFHLALILLSLLFTILGALGAFAGSIIRAAISRQREFLADSSAVQFTRNPVGIAGALRKIHYIAKNANPYMRTVHASNISHMCLHPSQRTWLFSSLLSSHPPLELRIERITGQKVIALKSLEKQPLPKKDTDQKRALLDLPIPFVVGSAMKDLQQMDSAATGHGSHLVETSKISSSLSYEGERTEHREPLSIQSIPIQSLVDAKALAYALMHQGSDTHLHPQIASFLQLHTTQEELLKTQEFYPLMGHLKPLDLLLLAERTLSWLLKMSTADKETFFSLLTNISKLDKRIQTYERCLLEYYERRLSLNDKKLYVVGKKTFEQEEEHIAMAMSGILHIVFKSTTPMILQKLSSEKDFYFFKKYVLSKEKTDSFKFKNLYFLETLNSSAQSKFLKLLMSALQHKKEDSLGQLFLLLCCAIMNIPFDVLSAPKQ